MIADIRFTGTLKTYPRKKGNYNFYLYCNHIERLSEELFIEDDIEEAEKEYRDRTSPEYQAWKSEVVSRDKVCKCCGSEKHPVAHHVFSYENYPKLRVDPNNGIRLCKWCHGKYHSHYGITNANPKTFTEFTSKVVWYFHLFVVIHTVKGFSQVNETEVDVFLKCLCCMIQ